MPRPLKSVVFLLLALLLCALLWQWLSAQGLLTAERLRGWVHTLADQRQSVWMLPAVLATYSLALLVMFPLTILVITTGLLFGPWWGLAYATAGTLSSSVASYWVGRRLGREALLRYGGRRFNRLSRYLARRGVRTMTLVNLLPLAPFTLTNMLAGAFHLRFRDYLLGSALGIIPGLAAVTLLGSQLGALLTAGDPSELLWAATGLVLVIAALLLIRRFITRRQRERALPAMMRNESRDDGNGQDS